MAAWLGLGTLTTEGLRSLPGQPSQVALVGKNQPASAGDVGDAGSVPGSGRSPGEGNGNRLWSACLENPHGQGSLAGYSPWSLKESDMTEVT